MENSEFTIKADELCRVICEVMELDVEVLSQPQRSSVAYVMAKTLFLDLFSEYNLEHAKFANLNSRYLLQWQTEIEQAISLKWMSVKNYIRRIPARRKVKEYRELKTKIRNRLILDIL